MSAKNQLLKEIKQTCNRFQDVRFPRDIDLSYTEKQGKWEISVTIQDPCANMQSNEGAFEGWILCIKAALGDRISRFILRWKVRHDNEAYQQFLLRVIHFATDFPDIVSVETEWERELTKSKAAKPEGDWKNDIKINSPSNCEERGKSSASGKEANIEREIVKYDGARSLASFLGVSFARFDNQLPVGLFRGKISDDAENRITTGGKSAIDLWGIDTSGATHLFELKRPEAKMVGIISELLYYSYVLAGVQLGRVKSVESQKTVNIASKIYEASPNKVNIKAHFLVFDLHPFITQGAIDLINEHLKGIVFRGIRVVDETTPYEFDDFFPEKNMTPRGGK